MNFGFESNEALCGWTPYLVNPAIDRTEPHGGTASCKICLGGFGTGSFSRRAPSAGPGRYTIQGFVRGPTLRWFMRIDTIAAGSVSGGDSNAGYVSANWTLGTGARLTTAPADEVQFVVEFESPGTECVWLDDVTTTAPP